MNSKKVNVTDTGWIEYCTAKPQYEPLLSIGKFMQAQADEIASLQARIDALMREYCPEEMTEEQLINWAKHQKVTK